MGQAPSILMMKNPVIKLEVFHHPKIEPHLVFFRTQNVQIGSSWQALLVSVGVISKMRFLLHFVLNVLVFLNHIIKNHYHT